MATPIKVSSGQKVLPEHINNIIDWVKGLIPKGDGKTTKVTSTQNSVTISSLAEGGVTFYKITTTGSNTCTVKSFSDENGVLTETDIPGTFPCAFPCVATGEEVPVGNIFLAFKVGTIYVADPMRWIEEAP